MDSSLRHGHQWKAQKGHGNRDTATKGAYEAVVLKTEIPGSTGWGIMACPPLAEYGARAGSPGEQELLWTGGRGMGVDGASGGGGGKLRYGAWGGGDSGAMGTGRGDGEELGHGGR
ncbi:unnamed protein product [Calypogeia fissa]